LRFIAFFLLIRVHRRQLLPFFTATDLVSETTIQLSGERYSKRIASGR